MPLIAHPTTVSCVVCGKTQRAIFYYHGFHYYRCTACSTVSTYPLPTSAAIKAHYARGFQQGNYKFQRDYAKQYESVHAQFVTVLEKRLREQGGSLKGKKVLDIGCFTGDFLALLAKKGADIYGLELQPEAVKLANKRLPGRVFEADVMTHKFPQQKYDIITLLGLVEHVTKPTQLLRRAAQLLPTGGLVMVQTPNSSSFLARALGKYWPPYSPVEHIHLFSKQGLTVALRDAGFTDIHFKAHWKFLPIGYVYNMFNIFGPEFRTLLKPLNGVLDSSPIILPFYVGEMIAAARKS